MQINSSQSLPSSGHEAATPFQYPPPLPPLRHELLTDNYGMPLKEKHALKMAWRLIAPQVRRLGRETFYEFLTAHHDYIEFFRDERSGKLRLEQLHAHGRHMYEWIGYIIEQSLDNHHELARLTTHQIDSHRVKGVPSAYVDQLLDVIMQKIFEAISDHYSMSVKLGFEHLRVQLDAIRQLFLMRNSNLSVFGREEAIKELKRKFSSVKS